MWKYMEETKPSMFVKDYERGIERVKRGGYAFLMESTMLDYVVQRDCNLTQIGGLLDSKGKYLIMKIYLSEYKKYTSHRNMCFPQYLRLHNIYINLFLLYVLRLWYCNSKRFPMERSLIPGYSRITGKRNDTNVIQ